MPSKRNNFFFLDAETDGLYGSFLSVAVLVKDFENRTIDSFYAAVKQENISIHSQWVGEHVLPCLCNAHKFFDSEYALLEAFWAFWMKYRDSAYAVGDVISPVETRLFSECVKHNEAEREMLAPFPLLDLASILIANGIDPLKSRIELAGISLKQHDSMNDVILLSDIWFRYWRKNEID